MSFVSITGAVLTGMIGVSLEKISPGLIPAFSPAPTVHEARLAGANVVFAHAGHVASFTLFSEVKRHQGLPESPVTSASVRNDPVYHHRNCVLRTCGIRCHGSGSEFGREAFAEDLMRNCPSHSMCHAMEYHVQI